jgi:hypothetical protein
VVIAISGPSYMSIVHIKNSNMFNFLTSASHTKTVK